jgi:hypothetical protein
MAETFSGFPRLPARVAQPLPAQNLSPGGASFLSVPEDARTVGEAAPRFRKLRLGVFLMPQLQPLLQLAPGPGAGRVQAQETMYLRTCFQGKPRRGRDRRQ